MRGATQEVLARDDSWVVKRAPFLKKQVWVVKDNKEERNWPAGKYVPQTYVFPLTSLLCSCYVVRWAEVCYNCRKEAPADSVVEWTKDDGTLENEDLLVFLTVGTHFLEVPSSLIAQWLCVHKKKA